MSAARIGVILAGGQSRRMAGPDKATLDLNGQRLIDHVIARLSPQVDHIILSAPHDYGTELSHVPDRADGPRGPAAGLWSVWHYIQALPSSADGFLTVPVDSPFFPLDIYARLSGEGCTVAATADRWHPTVAYWQGARLGAVLSKIETGQGVVSQGAASRGVALKTIAKACDARAVQIKDADALMNINTPEDWAQAQSQIEARSK